MTNKVNLKHVDLEDPRLKILKLNEWKNNQKLRYPNFIELYELDEQDHLDYAQKVNYCIQNEIWWIGKIHHIFYNTGTDELYFLTDFIGKKREVYNFVFDIIKHHPNYSREYQNNKFTVIIFKTLH